MEYEQASDNEVVKFSLSLPGSVYQALAQEAAQECRETQDFMRWLLIEHALQSGFVSEGEKEMLELYRNLSNRAADVARDLESREGFSPDITLRTFKACSQDPDWFAGYKRYVGGDAFASGNTRKASLNQNIGYRIKQAVGAELDLGPNGKKITVKVNAEIIKSYSQLKKP